MKKGKREKGKKGINLSSKAHPSSKAQDEEKNLVLRLKLILRLALRMKKRI
jgi:hypothetical protein